MNDPKYSLWGRVMSPGDRWSAWSKSHDVSGYVDGVQRMADWLDAQAKLHPGYRLEVELRFGARVVRRGSSP